MKFRREMIVFGLVGTVGFLVDTGVLYLIKGELGLYWARVFSFFCAATATWWLNRQITFRHRESGMSMTQEYVRYFGLMLGGGVVNYLVYAIAIALIPATIYSPMISIAMGSVAGMVINYLSARYIVFRKKLR